MSSQRNIEADRAESIVKVSVVDRPKAVRDQFDSLLPCNSSCNRWDTDRCFSLASAGFFDVSRINIV